MARKSSASSESSLVSTRSSMELVPLKIGSVTHPCKLSLKRGSLTETRRDSQFGMPPTEHASNEQHPDPSQSLQPNHTNHILAGRMALTFLKENSPAFGERPIQPSRPPAALKCARWNELKKRTSFRHSSMRSTNCQPAQGLLSIKHDS